MVSYIQYALGGNSVLSLSHQIGKIEYQLRYKHAEKVSRMCIFMRLFVII